MSNITNFPTYSSSENIATNHTILLMSRLYSHSAEKFQMFLSSLIDTDEGVETDVYFGQQERQPDSVPDGIIYQKSFRVIIETKTSGIVGPDQLRRHLEGFSDEDQQFLLVITTEKLDHHVQGDLQDVVAKFNQDRSGKVVPVDVTFRDIVDVFRETIEKWDVELQNVIDDYEMFCVERHLISRQHCLLRAVPCSHTMLLNKEYNIYYMPADRGYQPHAYIGLYADKRIQSIGKVDKNVEVQCDLEDNTLEWVAGDPLSMEEQDRILNVVHEAFDRFGHRLSEDTRFFLVEKFYDTSFRKKSMGGMRGARYFDLSDLLDNHDQLPSAEDIALELEGTTWE